jgi:hypothetical protein
VPLSGLPRVFVRALACTSMQTPVCALHTASLRPALASCAVSDKKRARERFCAQDATRAGSAANHSGSSPGSPWHRQLGSSRRSLTFSASAAAHAVSAARARRPSRRFLDITVHCCCPAQLPCITHNSPAWRGQRVARPRRAGAAAGPGGPPSRPTLSALNGAQFSSLKKHRP